MKSLVNSFILAFTLVVTVNIVGTLSVLLTEYWDIKGARVLKLAYMSSLIYGGVVLVSGYKYVYGANGLLTKLLVSLFPGMNPNWFVGYGAVVFVMTFSCTQNHMMFLKMILLAVFSRIEKGGNYISVSKTKAKLKKQKISNPVFNVAAHVVAYAMFAIYVIPIILVIVYSFCDSLTIKTGNLTLNSFTLANYQKLFTSAEAIKPYIVSIVYSLLAAVLAVLMAVICARFVRTAKHKYDVFFEWGMLIPWLLPATLIALGLTTTYGERQPILFNYVMVGTLVLMLVGYTVVKLPFSYRMVKAAFFSIDNDLEEAAKCMGAGTLYTMIKVILPVIFPAIMSIIILNFNGMLSDYDLSVFLYHPLFQPLGIVVKAASDESASIDARAMGFVYTVVLMILSSVALYFGQGDGMERIRRWKQRRFEKRVAKG